MKRYTIRFHRKAKKFITGLQPHNAQRLTDAIDLLALNPRPQGCIKLRDYKPDAWRIRVGKYRVVYQIHDDELFVWVFNVDLRDDAYSN